MKNKISKLHIFLLLLALALMVVLALVVFRAAKAPKAEPFTDDQLEQIWTQGYVPVDTAMQLAGFSGADGEYTKEIADSVTVSVTFDFDAGKCYKNEYTFDISDASLTIDGIHLLKTDKLSEILNMNFSYSAGNFTCKIPAYTAHQWTTEFMPLIAHAGGTIYYNDITMRYTNSKEAMVQSYDLGFRVFEFDFALTSDGKLAAVHDWDSYGNCNGVPMSEAEWLNDYEHPKGYFTTMMIGDILDAMLVNRDMFLVTDTKSYELSDEETRLQFEIIYEEAMKRDPELLERIIPQIYSESMYNLISEVYQYKSVIFTLYASRLSADEIVEFVSKHDEIKVVTMGYETAYFTETNLPARLEETCKLVYVHTVSNLRIVMENIQLGARGFYTDFITPDTFAPFYRAWKG